MAFGTNYFGAPGGYYGQPMPDQLAQFRQAQYPQYQQAMPQQTQPQAQQQPASSGITWVQGESGAKAYMVGAGNTVMLMDSEGDSFFIKSTDAAGMPMPLRIFDYTERTAAQRAAQPQAAEYITRAEFEALEAKISALMDKPKKKPIKEETEDA